MATTSYDYYMADLPWSPSREEELRFRKILLWLLLIFLILSIILPLLPLREKPKQKVVELPPRLARIIEQRKRPSPPPPQRVENIASKAKPKSKEKSKPKTRKTKPKKTVDTQVARNKAQSSGLLAFSSDLAELRKNHSFKNLRTRSLAKSGTQRRKTVRSLVTNKAGKGSGGINTANLSRDTGGSGIGRRNTTRVSGPISSAVAGRENKGQGRGHKATRDLEQIQVTFDRNKAAIYTIYNRALRKDPSLQGKVLLKITISPSGKVTVCSIASSELGDPKLERKLVQRIKLINFGVAEVSPFTFSYPIDFFPA